MEDLLVNTPDNNSDKLCTRLKYQVCNFDESKGMCMERSIVYSNTCLICKDKGTPHVYWGESAASTYERALQHIDEAVSCNPKSHIYQHILMHHPEGIKDIQGSFKFQVIAKHTSSFNRQLSEAIEIKKSKVSKMNNKLMYNRCVIPEIGITQPDWKTGEERESLLINK